MLYRVSISSKNKSKKICVYKRREIKRERKQKFGKKKALSPSLESNHSSRTELDRVLSLALFFVERLVGS